MAQHKVYTSNAERQKAYRERLKGSPVASPMKKIRISRPISKPKRLQALLAEAEDLLQNIEVPRGFGRD